MPYFVVFDEYESSIIHKYFDIIKLYASFKCIRRERKKELKPGNVEINGVCVQNCVKTHFSI